MVPEHGLQSFGVNNKVGYNVNYKCIHRSYGLVCPMHGPFCHKTWSVLSLTWSVLSCGGLFCPWSVMSLIRMGWLVGWLFWFNGPLRQYFSLYQEGERKEKRQTREKISIQPPPAPTASAIGPCPTVIQISRTPCRMGDESCISGYMLGFPILE